MLRARGPAAKKIKMKADTRAIRIRVPFIRLPLKQQGRCQFTEMVKGRARFGERALPSLRTFHFWASSRRQNGFTLRQQMWAQIRTNGAFGQRDPPLDLSAIYRPIVATVRTARTVIA